VAHRESNSHVNDDVNCLVRAYNFKFNFLIFTTSLHSSLIFIYTDIYCKLWKCNGQTPYVFVSTLSCCLYLDLYKRTGRYAPCLPDLCHSISLPPPFLASELQLSLRLRFRPAASIFGPSIGPHLGLQLRYTALQRSSCSVAASYT